MSCLKALLYRIRTSRVSRQPGSIVNSPKHARAFKVNPIDQPDIHFSTSCIPSQLIASMNN